MSLLHVRSRLFDTPLLLTRGYGEVVVSALADRLEVEPLVQKATLESYHRPNYESTFDEGTGVATMSIVGGMVHRGGFMEAMSGIQSYAEIQNELGSLLANNRVRGVLLDLDTPGGQVSGLEELADFIAAAEKPVWAIANTMACSAGYWLGAACDKLILAPSASVGSIGVIVMHSDMSKAMDKKGIVTTLIYAGAHKADGNPFGPLPDDVRADVQASVNETYDKFIDAIAYHRGIDPKTVRATEAGVLDPDSAIEQGFADWKASFGDARAELADFVGPRSHVRQFQQGSGSMATFNQDDLNRARAEGKAEGERTTAFDHTTALATAKAEGVVEGEKRAGASVMAAVNALVPGNGRLEAFGEAMSDGMSVSGAQKVAMRVPLPEASAPAGTAAQGSGAAQGDQQNAGGNGTTRTAADVDKHMQGHAPKVATGDEQNLTDKEKRLAELRQAGKSLNARRGYGPAH